MLRTRFSEALKDALKSKNERVVHTVRLVMAALKDKDIAARPKGVTAIPDEEILQMMAGMVKQRRESIEMFEKGGRPELAKAEQEEIDIIQSFMPKQMDEAEQTAAIKAAIAQTGASSVKDMGKVMAVLKEKHAGQMDFSKASGLVKATLG
ncbi:MAG: GatB/YqeY domain-containing protein [Rhodospirillaceae bacterium]|nr:GatB/YqeY domain-containing protein [Rhodospirillaceae bacterium]